MMNTHDRQEFDQFLRRQARLLAAEGLRALGTVYDQVGPRIVRYVRAIVRHHDDAEDVLQATLLKLMKHPEALSRAEHPWAYLLRIARNEALTLLDRQKSIDLLSSFPDIDVSTHDVCWQIDLGDAVAAALQHLPPNQKEVIVLKIWEDLTFMEIASILGESPNTVASRYRYALEKLEHLLESSRQHKP
jgi:RNA polymerase sigma-70 factor (ECF subfamily)